MTDRFTLLRSKPHYERRPLPISSSAFVQHRRRFPYRMADWVVDLCGRYAFVDRNVRLFAYFLLATVLAFLGQLFEPLPRLYFTQKRNLLNDYVVKLGLLWTTGLLLPFIFFTAKVYSGSNNWNIARQLSRLVVNYAFWFVVTAVVIKVENWTGICSLHGHDLRLSCVKGGGRWFAFEISGHCFLLTYCSLSIAEELLVFRDWYHIRCVSGMLAICRFINGTTKPKFDDLVILEQFITYTSTVQTLFVLSTILMLLWDIMFLITTLYYHTWIQNIVGVAFAGVAWRVTYGLWYQTPYSPGMPGDSDLKNYIDSMVKD